MSNPRLFAGSDKSLCEPKLYYQKVRKFDGWSSYADKVKRKIASDHP
jgi:hypothetical protein